MSENEDISILKIVSYNLLFFVPLILLYIISYIFSQDIASILQTSSQIAIDISMLFLSLVLFIIIIPIVRLRESTRTIRITLALALVTGLLIVIPSFFIGNTEILFSSLLILANFSFVSFLTAPGVIGVSGEPEDWIKHKVQIAVLLIYLFIVLLYIFGFSWLHYSIAQDTTFANSYRYSNVENLDYSTFVYYSIVTISSLGYGDIIPLSPTARLITSIQIIFGMVINVLFIVILLMYVSTMVSQSLLKSKFSLETTDKMLEEDEKILKEEQREINSLKDEIKKLQMNNQNYSNLSETSNQQNNFNYQNNENQNYNDNSRY